MFTRVNYYVTNNHNKNLGKTQKMENQKINQLMKDLGMTIGIEIETVRENKNNIARHLSQEISDITFMSESYNHSTRPHWKVVDDATAGAELVSPILTNENVFDHITKICQSLNRMQSTDVSRSCGLHIHLKWDGMTIEHIKKIVSRYHLYQNDFDLIMPLSRRENRNTYCLALTDADVRRVKNFRGNRLYQMKNLLRNGSYSTRYKKINLESLAKYGTLEFRQHSGTIDHTKILNWVCFLVGFVKTTISQNENTFTNFVEKKSAPFREIKDMFKMKNWTMKYGGGKKWNFFNSENQLQFTKTVSEINDFYTRDRIFETPSSLNDNFKDFWNNLFNDNIEEETFYKGIDEDTKTYVINRHNHFATLEGRPTI